MNKNKSHISKLVLCSILISSVFMCSACGTHLYHEGMDEYYREISSIGLTKYLIPDDFLEEFEYVDGYFYYKLDEPLPLTHTVEATLMYLCYDDAVYGEAKNEVLSAFEIDIEADEVIGSYGRYDFYVNKKSRYETNSQHFNAFTFNDNTKTLIFIGFDTADKLYDFEDNKIVDFDDLLKTYFPWYDFEDTAE